jgi:hypothetical protein
MVGSTLHAGDYASSDLDRQLSALHEPLPDKLYYAITLTADEHLKVTFGIQSQWTGWADEEMRQELREARLVYPRFVELWQGLKQPYSVIHTIDEATLFLLGGGNALVEKELGERLFAELLNAHPVVPFGERGFMHPEMLDQTAFRKAPTPKLRMRILVRDGRKCRICGRRPDQDVDLQLDIHHIRPWVKGGVTDPANLITLCHTCHKGLDPHDDHTLFRYLDRLDGSDSCEDKLKEILQGIFNYRKVGFLGNIDQTPKSRKNKRKSSKGVVGECRTPRARP